MANGILHYEYKGRKFSLHQHENNPGHWLHNTETWAAEGFRETVESENGYPRGGWRVVGREGYILSTLENSLLTEEEKRECRMYVEGCLNGM